MEISLVYLWQVKNEVRDHYKLPVYTVPLGIFACIGGTRFAYYLYLEEPYSIGCTVLFVYVDSG